MSGTSLEPAFIDGQRGKLFVLLRRPEGADPAPCVLIVPPFAEEMNKTWPMLSMVAQELAASMMEDRKETVSGLREQLRAGETLEVAGYELVRGLVAQVDSARLAPNIAASLGALH